MREVSLKRILALAVLIAISAATAYFFSDAVRLSEKPSEYIAVVFSILAASLFAVVSIVGDPSMIMPGNARAAWESAKAIQEDLQRFNYLFLWYLVTLGLLVITEVVEHQQAQCLYWVFYVFTFFATFGFLVSLALPFEFSQIQRSRLQQEFNARQKPKT